MFDSNIENYFYFMNRRGRTVRYECDERGLYVRRHLPPIDCYVYQYQCHVTSIGGFTQHNIERSSRARKLYHDLSAENVADVKILVCSNITKNVPVSVEDLNLVEEIYKADVENCKEKSTRPLPHVVMTGDIIVLPPKLESKKQEVGLEGIEGSLFVDPWSHLWDVRGFFAVVQEIQKDLEGIRFKFNNCDG